MSLIKALFFIFHIPQLLLSKENKEEEEGEEKKILFILSSFSFVWSHGLIIWQYHEQFSFFFSSDIYFRSMLDLLFSIWSNNKTIYYYYYYYLLNISNLSFVPLSINNSKHTMSAPCSLEHCHTNLFALVKSKRKYIFVD